MSEHVLRVTSRRSMLAGAGAFAAFGTSACAQPPLNPDTFQDWVSASTIPVRSIDSHDEDFNDLRPLGEVIGNARIVQLGECGHGAGSAFAAKVRLIKYLHQHLGFDVLVGESGFHGMAAVDAGLAGSDPLPLVALRGLFSIYGLAQQVQPLLEYARTTQRSSRPLNFAGFDMQYTSPYEVDQLRAHLQAATAKVPNLELREAILDEIEQTFAAYSSMLDQPTQENSDVLSTVSNRLYASMSSYREAITQPNEAADLAFLLVALENLRQFGTIYAYVAPNASQVPTKATFIDRDRFFAAREQRNAENLSWLANVRYPGRKLIVWAHNIHVAHAWFAPGLTELQAEARSGYSQGMGRIVADEFGDDVYTIAMTTYEGEDQWVTANQAEAIAPAIPGSLEATLHNLGHSYAFLNLRSTRDEAIVPPITMRLPAPAPAVPGTPLGYGFAQSDDLPRLFDGVFYIDEMMPAVEIPIPSVGP